MKNTIVILSRAKQLNDLEYNDFFKKHELHFDEQTNNNNKIMNISTK